MSEHTLILCPPRLSGYQTLALDDARRRGESPVALRIDTPQHVAIAGRWLDVAHKLVVYADFEIPDAALELVAEAEMAGVTVEERTLGKRPSRTIRERIAQVLS